MNKNTNINEQQMTFKLSSAEQILPIAKKISVLEESSITTRHFFSVSTQIDNTLKDILISENIDIEEFIDVLSYKLSQEKERSESETGEISNKLKTAILSASKKKKTDTLYTLLVLKEILSQKDNDLLQILYIANIDHKAIFNKINKIDLTTKSISTTKNKKSKNIKNNNYKIENKKEDRGNNDFRNIGSIFGVMMGDMASIMASGIQDIPNQGNDNNSNKNMLDLYAINLTDLAKKDKLDNLIGRSEEIERLEISLSRRLKNNPVLIGEAGVGKTAIVEGLAQNIVSNKAKTLKDVEIYAMDLAGMVAGTKYRGEFEKRLTAFIKEAEEKKSSIIIFIDEIHMLVGAGAVSGSMDASNIMKTALARGKIRIIGATTQDEFKTIEEDQALLRRLQPILVKEPNTEESIEIIKGVSKIYSDHHKISFQESLASSAVLLTERYLPHRYQPDKTIDLIDEAYATVKRTKRKSINLSDLQNACARLANLPINAIKDENTKYLNLEKDLEQTIKGQSTAITLISKKIRLSKSGIKRTNRPMSSFLLVGKHSLGKSSLAKELADKIFPSVENILHLDMTEYKDSASLTSLIGASAGYIGYTDDPRFEFVRRNPYCLILFDGIENAHKDVVSLINQILNNGKITDTQDRVMSFEHCIVISTLNITEDDIKQQSGLGFKNQTAKNKQDLASEMKQASKNYLPDNFINSNTIIPFVDLDTESKKSIVNLELEKITKEIYESKKIKISFSENTIKEIIKDTENAENICHKTIYILEDILSDVDWSKISKNKNLTIDFKNKKYILV